MKMSNGDPHRMKPSLTKMKLSTDDFSLSSYLSVILSSQLLCFVTFTVSGWLLRRIYSLCLKTVNVERFMVCRCFVVLFRIYPIVYLNSFVSIRIHFYTQFMFVSTEEWLYKLFMHQACVFENKYQ